MVFGKIENIFISGTKLALHFLKSRDFCISLLLGLDFDVIDQMLFNLFLLFFRKLRLSGPLLSFPAPTSLYFIKIGSTFDEIKN